MFSKKSKGTATPTQQPAPVKKPSAPSLISGDLKIVGDLTSDGEIQVDGTIVGDIRTKVLLVGESADIKGEIVADSVRVHGRINGQIKARSVLLSKTAHMVGDIMHEDLAIETGAFLEGHCKRMVQTAEKPKLEGKPIPAKLEAPNNSNNAKSA
jgi:cytoskeletal protein CcmA (bactofilin family)